MMMAAENGHWADFDDAAGRENLTSAARKK